MSQQTVVARAVATGSRPLDGGRLWIGLVALGTALLRLPYVHAPVSPDEGGFLVVARGWHAGGTSLYGDHWVDRPPLLLGIYKVAELLGGLTPLRLIAAAAAAVAVLFVGLAARRVAGREGGIAAALMAGLMLVPPALGTIAANGELLASPFIAIGVWGAIAATQTAGSESRRTAAIAGAAAMCAVLVKQNMVDVVVFTVVLALLSRRTTSIRQVAVWFGIGLAAAGAALLGIAALLGTHPGSVFFAMYPFRLRAAAVMGYVPWATRWGRISHLAEAFLVTAGPLVLAALGVLLARRRLEPRVRAVAIATAVTTAYALFSVLAGGSYWTHYLVELVVPTALAAGLVASSARRWARPLLAVGLVTSGIGWAVALHTSIDATGVVIGRSIGAASAPDDTVVSLLGDGDLVEASGLSTPYRYPWSLPSRTLDPHLTRLDALLEGPHAPTWIVVRGSATQDYVERSAAGATFAREYRPFGVVCGREVYLHVGVSRPQLPQPGSCRLPLT